MALASTALFKSIPMLVAMYATTFQGENKRVTFPDNPPTLGLPVAKEYDFIVVGGGTSGCIVARRLVEQNYKVLLLESGGDPVPMNSVPLLSKNLKSIPDINHMYQSAPQLNGRVFAASAGKMMGGSSSNNDMQYEVGSAFGYDEWAETTGDRSWRYEKILPFFKKSVHHRGDHSLGALTGEHGTGGPLLTVSKAEYGPGTETFIEGAQELGYSLYDSKWHRQQVGVTSKYFFTKDGKRDDVYSAYIKDFEKQKKNLVVSRYSVADKIIFEGNVATGVSYTMHGTPLFAYATKEVILSAGTFASPIILIKSGIGPEDQVQAANVQPVRIAPGVGKNLHDLPVLAVGPIFVTDPSKSVNIDQDLAFDDFDKFLASGSGIMTSSYTAGTVEIFTASTRAAEQDGHRNWPDLQISYQFVGPVPNSVQCNVGLNRPYSHGEVLLNPADATLPIINYNYFTVDSDFDVVIQGIKVCLDLVEKTSAFKNIGARFTKDPIPECTSMPFRSDEYWRCYIQHLADSTSDASGTCRMGKIDDPMAVVDSKFKVIGVKNLRVVDTSVMPKAPNVNSAASAVMIAEKAAHDIIEKHEKTTSLHKPRPELSLPRLGLGNIVVNAAATAG